MAKERKFWEILAESQHDKLVLSWLSVVLTVLVIASERVACWCSGASKASGGCSWRCDRRCLQCRRDA